MRTSRSARRSAWAKWQANNRRRRKPLLAHSEEEVFTGNRRAYRAEASQRFASVVLGLLGHAGIRRTIEAVIGPWIHVQLGRDPGAAQPIRIGQVFFKKE